MSTQPIVSSGGSGAPINITGLSSGLNTTEIINALMAVQRLPVGQLTNQQTKLEAEQAQLRQVQSGLQQLAFSAADLSSPTLFQTSQTVTTSNPNQITALSTTGAGVGGYQVNVTQLANSAQRTFTFASPASADTVTIDGQEIAVKAGASIQELVNSINSDSNATVYAAALESGKVVLSSRVTGNTGEGFIAVSDPGGTLTEQAGTAKQGKNAEYTVDGVAGTSSSNTVTNAIAGSDAEPGRAHDRERPGDDRGGRAGGQHERDRRTGRIVREALQLDDRTAPQRDRHQAARTPAERGRTGHRNAVRRRRIHRPGEPHAPGDLHLRRRAPSGNGKPRGPRHQHRSAPRAKPPPPNRPWKAN